MVYFITTSTLEGRTDRTVILLFSWNTISTPHHLHSVVWVISGSCAIIEVWARSVFCQPHCCVWVSYRRSIFGSIAYGLGNGFMRSWLMHILQHLASIKTRGQRRRVACHRLEFQDNNILLFNQSDHILEYLKWLCPTAHLMCWQIQWKNHYTSKVWGLSIFCNLSG